MRLAASNGKTPAGTKAPAGVFVLTACNRGKPSIDANQTEAEGEKIQPHQANVKE